jgi:hypothetical protein
MNRRETRKNIRKAERYLTQTAWEYLQTVEPGRDTEENGPLLFLSSNLTIRIACAQQIGKEWNRFDIQ